MLLIRVSRKPVSRKLLLIAFGHGVLRLGITQKRAFGILLSAHSSFSPPSFGSGVGPSLPWMMSSSSRSQQLGQ